MKRIIIVEDDPMISEIYQRKFSEAGFETRVAESGDQAIKQLEKEPADVMTLDLIMPKMDGFEVIRNIREVLGNNDIKIFVFSNLSQKEDQERAKNLGANGFIIKSEYTPSDLVKEVSRRMNIFQEEKRNESIQKSSQENKIDEDKKKKILLIEDEKIFLEMFGGKLRQDGFFVETADNGAWGLKEALEKQFDCIIVDMVMPAMTGEEIITKLKSEEKTKNIPIIVISASVEPQLAEEMKKKGIEEFFVKTQIIPSELSKKVSEILL